MKKIYIAMAVLAAAALTSCMREQSFNDVKIGKNDIVFSLQGNASTRATDGVSVAKQGVILEFETSEDGQKLLLEETVQDLNYVSPATKGTPAYTENVGALYENMGVVIRNGATELLNTSGFYAMDDEMVGGGWRYQGEFSGWPENEKLPLDFYLRMPTDTAGLGFKALTYAKTGNNLNFTFTYTSPETASAQKDIIFAARQLSKSEHDTKLPNGAPVLFNHALTAVKFAIANYDEDKKITIKSVSFKGLVGTADCRVTPAVEDNYRDNKTNFSSGSATVVKWTIPENPDRSKTYSSGTFGAPVQFEKKTTTTDEETGEETTTGGKFAKNGEYPDSFTEGNAGKDNLNDADASQTFWFIPQTMTDDVELTIVYTFGDDEERTGVLEFGKAVNENSKATPVVWKAGQIRTYTIRVDEVNVMIEDKVTITDSTEVAVSGTTEKLVSYAGATKSDVKIKNTGNTDVYIRAALIGQWLDAESGDPVFGYTDFTSGEFVSVDSWYQDQFVNKTYRQGSFTGLPGTNWTLEDDGYYYYEDYIAPGAYVPNNLFTTYTVGTAPGAAVAGRVMQIYFRLEIATQAISAKKSDGTYYTREQAWAKANTPDPTVI